jgi:acetyltransferase-like isoleucine patch superfamily enzyme|tara:strand:+ start:2389 stop:2826 length:438 start_codon:yes stop_codon:yes gene_type:complete
MIVGLGTVIHEQRFSNIQRGVELGQDCIIHSHVWIGQDVKIGDRCKIQAFVFIPTGVTIGNGVFISPHVCFTNDKHPPSHGKDWSETIVEDEVVIGANATILPSITLGKGCKIGAGAVVTKSVPDGEMWVGNPARRLKCVTAQVS